MSEFTDHLSDALLNHVFRNSSYTSPGTSIYVALFTAVADGEAGSVTEVTGGSYAREQVTAWDAPSNAAGGGREIANTNTISFTEATGSWGTVTHFGVYDDSSAGNLLCYSALDNSRAISSGETAEFAAGALTIALD